MGHKLLITFLLCFPALVPMAHASTEDATRIAKVMREIQGRSRAVGLVDRVWPNCVTGVPAPPFPPDGFYAADAEDPTALAAKVASAKSAFLLVYTHYLKTQNLEGTQTAPENFVGNDLPASLKSTAPAVTSTNFHQVLQELEGFVAKLTRIQMAVSYGVWEGRWGQGFGSSCASSYSNAHLWFTINGWQDGPDPFAGALGSGGIGTYLRNQSSTTILSVSRGKITADLSSKGQGSEKIFLRIKSGLHGVGDMQAPPVGADLNWQL